MTDLKPLTAGEASGIDASSFCFRDLGPLHDAELHLLLPHERLIQPMLEVGNHPLTRQINPDQTRMTREQITRFLATAPSGHERGDRRLGRVPCYHFWMTIDPQAPAGSTPQPLSIAGTISLRAGHTEDVQLYYGHIGYGVYPPARGHHYAERACRLLLNLARHHDLNPLWITTDPDNHASRRTCERLGARLVETVPVPWGHPLYSRGQKRKCRYRLDL